jgi:hypothetical protein
MSLTSPRFRGNRTLEAAADNLTPQSPIARGERDREAVKAIQLAIHDMGILLPGSIEYSDRGVPVPDGIYGDDTYRAVRAYQRRVHLHEDGVVGADTMRRLDAQFPGLESLIQRPIEVRDVIPLGRRVERQVIYIGGVFEVMCVLVQDPSNEYRTLEYRQNIRGSVSLGGAPINPVFTIHTRDFTGRVIPIDANRFLEDADTTRLRSGFFYGHRNNSPVSNDHYTVVDADGRHRIDMLAGNVYSASDRYGMEIAVGSAAHASHNGTRIDLNLQFEGQIVHCASPGGPVARLVRTARWSRIGGATI